MSRNSDAKAAQIFNYAITLIAFVAGVVVNCGLDEVRQVDPVHLQQPSDHEPRLIPRPVGTDTELTVNERDDI